jgi:signal transduction histidine kinase
MVLKSSLEEIQRMSEIVATVLQAGEWERTDASIHPVDLDLAGWVEETLPRWEKTLGRPIEAALPSSGPVVKTDPRLIDHLVDNLVRNVRKHAPASACRLRIADSGEGARIVLSDDGPGMPSSLLDPLNRGKPVLEVAGVGLNLCQKIAKIAGLRLRFSNRPGGGVDAEILFPSSR